MPPYLFWAAVAVVVTAVVVAVVAVVAAVVVVVFAVVVADVCVWVGVVTAVEGLPQDTNTAETTMRQIRGSQNILIFIQSPFT